MPTSVFIDHHAHGLAFYLNGDLQFDTTDEGIYHEYLVAPALAIARQRFPETPLRILICGGGDGLAARDVLWFSQVTHVDLVDYNPDVIELGKTLFKRFNQDSLEDPRLQIYSQDAFEFVAQHPSEPYHVILCDFTYPTSSQETQIYSWDWFQRLHRVLVDGGLVTSNGVSPETRTSGFWCLYQTLRAAQLNPKPLQLSIPSFRQHGYGDWGFFLGSRQAILRSEVERLSFPPQFQICTQERLLKAFQFQRIFAEMRHHLPIHTLDCPQLYYYLLNPGQGIQDPDPTDQVDFLDIDDQGVTFVGQQDQLSLESTIKIWLDHLDPALETGEDPDWNRLLPVHHRYHHANMTGEWITYVKHLVSEIDLSKLLSRLLDRSQELPPKVAQNLRNLAAKLRSGESLVILPPHVAELVTMLSVTLMMANLITPDAVFAKGYYSRPASYHSGSSYPSSGSSGMKVFGVILSVVGGLFLLGLNSVTPDQDD